MIGSSQRLLPDNIQHLQQTDLHALRGIRTHNVSRRAAAELRLGSRENWEENFILLHGNVRVVTEKDCRTYHIWSDPVWVFAERKSAV
jgi:hypothetical protein